MSPCAVPTSDECKPLRANNLDEYVDSCASGVTVNVITDLVQLYSARMINLTQPQSKGNDESILGAFFWNGGDMLNGLPLWTLGADVEASSQNSKLGSGWFPPRSSRLKRNLGN